jgi:hypothetical protein
VALAVLPPGPPPPLDADAGFAYWALGGSPEPRGGPVGGGAFAVVAAAPQPRAFPRPGPRPDAALLELGEAGPLPPRPLALADVELRSVEVDLATAPTPAALEAVAMAQLGEAPGEPQPVVAQLVLTGDGPARAALGGPEGHDHLLDRLRRATAASPVWWSDVVLLPLPPPRRGVLAARAPAARGIEARAAGLRSAGPGPLLVEARGVAGVLEPPWPPAPASWPGLVDEAASLALEVLGGRP